MIDKSRLRIRRLVKLPKHENRDSRKRVVGDYQKWDHIGSSCRDRRRGRSPRPYETPSTLQRIFIRLLYESFSEFSGHFWAGGMWNRTESQRGIALFVGTSASKWSCYCMCRRMRSAEYPHTREQVYSLNMVTAGSRF